MFDLSRVTHESIIQDVTGSEYDLMIFQDDQGSKTIIPAEEYNADQHRHLGNACTVLTPHDDDYLAALALMMSQGGSPLC